MSVSGLALRFEKRQKFLDQIRAEFAELDVECPDLPAVDIPSKRQFEREASKARRYLHNLKLTMKLRLLESIYSHLKELNLDFDGADFWKLT